MDKPADGLLIQRAIRQFSPDIFQHPVWLRFANAGPTQRSIRIQPLMSAAKQMQAERDNTGACYMLFLCAASQAGTGDWPAALESITQILKLAKRHHLPQVTIWGYWGAGAICAQMGAYAKSGEYLLRLEQELYRNNDWILANLIELVRLSLEERVWNSRQAGAKSFTSGEESTGLLIEQMLCWGKPLPEVTAEAGWPERSNAYILKTREPLQASGWGLFWQNLRRFLSEKLRGESIEDDGSSLYSSANQKEALPDRPVEPQSVIPVTSPASGAPLPAAPGLKVNALPLRTGDEQCSPLAQIRLPVLLETAAPVSADLTQAALAGTEPPAELTESLSEATAEISPGRILNAYLLGSFRVALGDTVVDNWPSGRSRAVFAYLLAHRAHPVPREVLMETFWPETTLDSARNSLNVAVYTLRQALKNIVDIPVIFSHEYAYQINPDLPLWIDVEAFEQHVHTALQRKSAGMLNEAIAEYTTAVGLYQGDFLAETPYEGWATLERERLRVLYLETLDHFSMIYFSQSLYAECVGLCQRILSQDACREDAHCRLMRCYARQGLAHQALRQYQTCVEALREELDVMPSQTTMLLNEQIKRREAV